MALRAVHFPKSSDELAEARRRLKFDELFYLQLMLALTKQVRHDVPGAVLTAERGPLVQRFLSDVLPFQFTGAQTRALDDALRDMASGTQMNRLVQGDVGSGKTVVAVAAILHAVDHGYQGAFLAPTEILAEQHAANLPATSNRWACSTGCSSAGSARSCAPSTSATSSKGARRSAVGTHALMEDRRAVPAPRARHRGRAAPLRRDAARARCSAKGERPHMLLMTATPIPRTLALTLYGDLDVSVMRRTPGRAAAHPDARAPEKRRGEVLEFVRTSCAQGGRRTWSIRSSRSRRSWT